jgi:hypothetical protein
MATDESHFAAELLAKPMICPLTHPAKVWSAVSGSLTYWRKRQLPVVMLGLVSVVIVVLNRVVVHLILLTIVILLQVASNVGATSAVPVDGI